MSVFVYRILKIRHQINNAVNRIFFRITIENNFSQFHLITKIEKNKKKIKNKRIWKVTVCQDHVRINRIFYYIFIFFLFFFWPHIQI